MAYLGDIREMRVGPNGEFWESDNRVEERHYWNGAFVDLCDLPAEDYAKTIFVTDGSSSGSGSSTGTTPTVQSKVMSLEIIDGDAVLTYAGEISSDLYVAISYNNGESHVIKVEAGTSGASGIPFEIGDVASIESFGIGNTEESALAGNKVFQDEEYKYQISFDVAVPIPVAYQFAAMAGNIDNMTDDDIIAKIQTIEKVEMVDETKSQTFTATIEPIAVEGLAEMNAVQMTDALLANAQDIIIVTDKEVVDILAASTADSVLEGWTERTKTVTIDGVVYYVWYKRASDTELSAIYDPAVPEAVIEVPADSITFIIKYA